MIKVHGDPVWAEVPEIINQLRHDSYVATGIELFRKVRQSGDSDVMVSCPFHKGGQERKPSFGISKIDGSCHCFACGWAGSLTQMISQVFGYDDDGGYGEK